LPAGASGTVDLSVTIDPAALSGAIFTQHATIKADQIDPIPANDTASVDSTVMRATDLGVTVTPDASTVTAGSVAGFTVTVTNNGPLAATDAQLVNALPTDLTSPADPPTCTFAGNTATCALGPMAVGASTAIHFTGTVPSTTPAGTLLTDDATVSHAEADTEAANDHASAVVTVVGAGVSAGGQTGSGSAPSATTSPSSEVSTSSLPRTGGYFVRWVTAGFVTLLIGAALTRAGRARTARARPRARVGLWVSDLVRVHFRDSWRTPR
jgi:uncharacterized repeat protein (TIGR01451 family)